jgi:hypothetical protein
MKGQVPQAILDPIVKEAAALAKVDREQLGDRARRISLKNRSFNDRAVVNATALPLVAYSSLDFAVGASFAS